jgi:hypothetical protein
MAMTVMTVGFEVGSHSLVDGYQHLKSTCCLHLKVFKSVHLGTGSVVKASYEEGGHESQGKEPVADQWE